MVGHKLVSCLGSFGCASKGVVLGFLGVVGMAMGMGLCWEGIAEGTLVWVCM